MFLFSYAGSFGYSYRQWESCQLSQLELIAIDYPGKGTRINEPPVSSWIELIKDATEEIMKYNLKEQNYLLFGHSMGAKVAYEVCLELQKKGIGLPKVVFFSGTEPFSKKTNLYLENDTVFRKKMIELGGISKEVLIEPELAEFVFSNLKEDALLLDQFNFEPKRRLKTYSVILSGDRDQSGTNEEWQSVCGEDFCQFTFFGDHFFIFESAEKVLNQIEQFI